ncbi:MAG: DUF6600 domain-containing protein [Pyrinomonadaceae bacterium]
MRYRTLVTSALSLLLLLTALHLCSSVAFADDELLSDDDYAYEETARVARISLLAGDVSLRRSGSDKWERATLNTPLVEGDRLATGSGSRVEIQIDSRNFVRVGEYATLDIVTLRSEGVALSLPEGTATLRLARFERDREYFEIDAPATTVAAQAKGLYRLDVDKDGRVRVSVREGGRARLYSESSGFTVRDGRVAESVFRDGSNEAEWEFSELRPFDNWDTWVDERERHLLARLRYDDRERYYDNQVVGGEELDAYGDWVQTRDYGYVWRPRTTVINNYYDWAPYRYGHWSWCPPYGWTWVGDEPWGWAPYHYGRWVYVDNYWSWAPRGYYGYRHRSWWRPALVAFVNVHLSFGDHVCWYPLPYHHSDPQSNFWRRARDRNRIEARQRKELADIKRVNPIWARAVSGLPARDFGRGNVRPQPTDVSAAKLALATDPVRGRLAVRPVEGEGGMANLRDRLSESKRAGMAARGGDAAGVPTLKVAERPTGAASRKAGVALDETLRRARILDNREPAVTKGAKGGDSFKDVNGADPVRRTSGGNVGGDARATGAVARPSRPIRVPDATNNPNDARGEKAGGEKNGGDDPKRTIRPVRPTPDSEDTRTRDGGGGAGAGEGERKTKPADRERRDGGERDKTLSPYERPTQPDARESRPAMPERSRERPEYKPSPVERREPPVERREPERRAEPAPRYERPDPSRREEPPAPQREERQSPPPREERQSPPPREERPSSPPPQREEKSAPPPSKSEPARESAKPTRERPPTND